MLPLLLTGTAVLPNGNTIFKQSLQDEHDTSPKTIASKNALSSLISYHEGLAYHQPNFHTNNKRREDTRELNAFDFTDDVTLHEDKGNNVVMDNAVEFITPIPYLSIINIDNEDAHIETYQETIDDEDAISSGSGSGEFANTDMIYLQNTTVEGTSYDIILQGHD